MTAVETPRTTTPASSHAISLPPIDLAGWQALAAQPGITLLDFSADRCPPCRMMMPVLESLAHEYRARVRVVTVDCDRELALAELFLVRSMPTFVVWRDGREVGRVVGKRPRPFMAGVLDRAIAGDVAIAGP